MKIFLSILLSLLCLTGCKQKEQPPVEANKPDKTEVELLEPQTKDENEAEAEIATEPQTEADTAQQQENQATLYIGMDEKFTEYIVNSDYADYTDSEQASLYLVDLMKQMGELTGWNLDCDISVYKSVGVSFKEESTLFVGPPEMQKEEFHLFEASQMAQTILDSVAKTIKMNIGGENPDLLEIYFSTDKDKELTFPNINMYVPINESYKGILPMFED